MGSSGCCFSNLPSQGCFSPKGKNSDSAMSLPLSRTPKALRTILDSTREGFAAQSKPLWGRQPKTRLCVARRDEFGPCHVLRDLPNCAYQRICRSNPERGSGGYRGENRPPAAVRAKRDHCAGGALAEWACGQAPVRRSVSTLGGDRSSGVFVRRRAWSESTPPGARTTRPTQTAGAR